MVFAVVGTQKFQMNRFLQELDDLVERGLIQDSIFAQIGASNYIPRNYQYSDFLSKEDFEQKMEECDLVITHGGVGTIISALKKNKPVIIYPRLSKYSEHVDDHQLQIASSFELQKLALVYKEGEKLDALIEKSRNYSFGKYISQREKNITIIRQYIDSI